MCVYTLQVIHISDSLKVVKLVINRALKTEVKVQSIN